MFADLGHFSQLSIRVSSYHLPVLVQCLNNLEMNEFHQMHVMASMTLTDLFISDEQIAFTVVVYPCLILAYMGEAAYLSKHKEDLQRSFYKSIPGKSNEQSCDIGECSEL